MRIVVISVPIQIDKRSDVPVRAQIASAYAQAIRAGRLPSGSALPSVRGLSSRLGVSPATVVAAYRELCDSGLASASPRSAFRVAGPVHAPANRVLQLNRIEPDLRLHPVAELARLLAEVAAGDCSIGGYEDYRGHAGLREAIADLNRDAGIESDPASGLLITSGAQQAISLIARSLDKGVCVACEDPCYPGARMAFSGVGTNIVPVRMGDDGPDAESLAAIARPGAVSAFYCCPTYGNPSGRSWSEEARLRVLEAACSGGFLIIEDDYLGDLDYLGEAPTRLAALARRFPQARVVHIRTFSKCLLPALRIAGVSGEPAFINRLVSLKVADDLGCSAYLQRALAHFIRLGRYHEHLERVRPHYRERRTQLRSMLAGIGGIAFDDPPAGLCLLGRLDEGVEMSRFVAECARNDLLISPGGDYWLRSSDGAQRFRIGFGSLSPDEMPLVASALSKALAVARSPAPAGALSIL